MFKKQGIVFVFLVGIYATESQEKLRIVDEVVITFELLPRLGLLIVISYISS